MYFYLSLIVIYLIYKWGTSTFDYFRGKGVPFLKPVFLFGTKINMLTKKLAFIDWALEMHNKMDEKVLGVFEFRQPVFYIRDPEIVKQMAVKDFDYFADHRTVIDENVDPLFGKSLISLKGQRWRDMRATLSPAFTGSKMRKMFELINQVGKQSVETVKKNIDKPGSIFEMREFFMKFTVDVIATCAFGLEVNSFQDPKNDFQNFAHKIKDFKGIKTALKVIGYLMFPKLMTFLKVRVFSKELCDFFQATIVETMKHREGNGIIRHDMIDLLMEVRKGKLSHSVEEKTIDGFATVEESDVGKSQVSRKWDDEEIAAQAFIFFFAGFETISTTMGFAAYELALNVDIQNKLRQEVDDTFEMLNGSDITYDHIQKMKYLDQVICETLRKWPAAPITDRICVKDYKLEYDNKSVIIEKGINFYIPVLGFHRDPKYYPDPLKFDPERFSEENKHKINLNAYLPFGVGPRNCIGSRFALMEVKVLFYYLLLNFKIEICEKTQIPLKFCKRPSGMRTEKGIWLKFNPRY